MDVLERINEKKIKGYLTINRRVVFEGAIYHITQRAPGKELVFLEDNDYLYFLKMLKETAQKFNLHVFSFALLTNHLHMLLQINEKNISSAMKRLFERYAFYFNKKYHRKGHVFCGRFRAALCNDNDYFLAISVYIHLNPYRAGLCNDSRDYRWSSVYLYTKGPKDTFIKFEKILSILDTDPKNAREQYIKILIGSMNLKQSLSLNTDSIKRAIREGARIVKKFIGSNEEKELEELINNSNKKERIRNMEDRKARKYAIEQLVAQGYEWKEIVDMLGISKSTFIRALKNS